MAADRDWGVVFNEWASRDPFGALRLIMGKVTARDLIVEKPDVWRAVCAAMKARRLRHG